MMLHVKHHAAWARGLETQEHWVAWAQGLRDFGVEGKPAVANVPAITRRRLTFWGRMGLQVAGECAAHVDAETPCIFSSRHGDTARTIELLQDIAKAEALSPTAFSLSVHNSSAGIFSITNQIVAGAVAIAAGKDTLGGAFIEAQGLLSQGASTVLLVHVDNELADFYKPDADEMEVPHGLALVLCKDNGRAALNIEFNCETLHADTRRHTQTFDDWSMALGFLKFIYGASQNYEYKAERRQWKFKKAP